MPPKGTKRKAVGDSNGTAALLPPDRKNWPGWVEQESEPAIFNILLKDMGVRGLAIREVENLDDFMFTLPLPIHGLIFLFEYNDADHSTEEAGKDAEDVWFANQVPEFSCATLAILNLVNNIPDLDLGRELREFKAFTKTMTPLERGDTIDSFDFVKRIHNSFARENDMLTADMVTQGKVKKAKGEQARQKARETREANKAEKAKTSANINKSTGKGTGRIRQPSTRAGYSASRGKSKASVVSDPSDTAGDSDEGYNPKGAIKVDKDVSKLPASPRRSGRAAKPRKVVTSADFETPDGYHYVAYVPIGDHVWKLDGMNKYSKDLGTFRLGGYGADGGTGNWLDVVTPMIRGRMSQYDSSIGYSLMAVVRDPFFSEKQRLQENIRTLLAVESKLNSLDAEWRSLEGEETKRDVITGISEVFGISQPDIEAAEMPPSARDAIFNENDLLKLIGYRQGILKEQVMLRSGVRDAMRIPKEEEEEARLRKHDYGPFVRGWLNALAEQEVLVDLLS